MKILGLIAVIIVLLAIARPAQKAEPWSPEQYRDFTRQVIEACRLPVGDRNRPSREICGR